MKAMQLAGHAPAEDKPLHLTDLEIPLPGEKELLIRVRACGVCRTDLHIVEGDLDLPVLPLMPGHQAIGTAEKLGAQCRRYRKGDRVGVAWLNRTCGRCDFCRNGRENLCESARFTGFHTNGGFADYMTVNEDYAYSVPDAVDDAHAAPLLCAGVIGYRALRLSQVQTGQILALYGFGASAHVTIQVACHWGCKVLVYSRSDAHLEWGRSGRVVCSRPPL